MPVRPAGAIAGLFLASLGAWAVVPATGQPAACLTPAAVADADVTRNMVALADPALCLTVIDVSDGGRSWRLVAVRNLRTPGPLWAVPHDEEDEGFDAGVGAVLRYGGVLVAVENGEQRLVDGRDPNQSFAMTAATARPCPSATGGPAPAYVDAFLADWDRRFPVIGLHSNWDGYLAGGGLGDISVRRADAKMIPFPSTLGTGRLADEDTIVMLVSQAPPTENPAGLAAVGWFNEHGVHVIYRHVTPINNGCTLADYLTLNQLGPYLNVEVEHGDHATADVLIDLVMEFVRTPGFPGML